MSDYVIELFLNTILALSFSAIAFFGVYKLRELELNHEIELQKAKNGIFDVKPKTKFSFKSIFKEHLAGYIIGIISLIAIIILCFVLKVPSSIARYIIELVK